MTAESQSGQVARVMSKSGDQTNIFLVVMCGGYGSRLWPASRPSHPKQFIPLVGPDSLFRQTVNRMRNLKGLRQVVVVAGQRHARFVAAEMPELDIGITNLLEPEGRGTAPAIAAATAHIERIDPEGLMVVVASDHFIPDEDAFRADIDAAVDAAREGGIVTLGIAPTKPSPAYGYILPGFASGKVGPAETFVEKPDAETAARFLAAGYLWNSGNFIATVKTMIRAFEAKAPDVIAAARRGISEGRATSGGMILGNAFRGAPKVSFDHAIMETSKSRKVVRSDIAWSDLGAWDAVHEALPRDTANNAVTGDALLIDSENCHVRVAPGQYAVVTAVDGLNVTVEDDVVFVSRLNRSQGVKSTVDELRKRDRHEVDIAMADFDAGAKAKEWSHWLHTTALPVWWTHGFDHALGLWRESLNPNDARPTDQNVRARVQGRQTYVYARAAQDGWAGPWQAAIDNGLSAIETHFKGADGLLPTLANPDGTIADDTTMLYDQTFVLLALAQAKAFIDDAEARALTLLSAIEARFSRTDDGRGFRENGDHPWQSNAHMHLFEAALAWIEIDGSPRWRRLAEDIALLARDHFIDADGGFVREFFQDDWSPAKGDDGKVVEPGHQFEWAWLLGRWAALSKEAEFYALAERLYAVGLYGVDPARGVAFDRMNDELKPVTDRARLWPQTEWVKASALLAQTNPSDQGSLYAAHLAEAWRAVEMYLGHPVNGLWYDKMNADGSFEIEPVPASSLYHIVGAIEALEAWSTHEQSAAKGA